MATHLVRDGSRLLQFDGVLLGAVSSKRETSSRWSEINLYRTEGGSYVMEKVGRSIVTHVPGCSDIIGEIPRFQVEHPGDDPDDYQYHDCVPEVYDFTRLLSEEDRYWGIIAQEPEEIVEALYRKRDGAKHLTRISLDLLEAVSKVDPAFRSEWRVEHIA